MLCCCVPHACLRRFLSGLIENAFKSCPVLCTPLIGVGTMGTALFVPSLGPVPFGNEIDVSRWHATARDSFDAACSLS